MAKKIKLIHKGGECEHDIAHVQRILRYEAFKGWKIHTLPSDSNYEFVNNELRIKSDKGTSKTSSKSSGTTKSDKAK